MNRTQRDDFYVAAALQRDLDSDQVDAILSAAGLSTRTHTFAQCRDAINTHLLANYTPAPPPSWTHQP